MEIFLPESLIERLLILLRVKPLLRFRSVSKNCLSLIDSPEFISLHKAYWQSRHGILIYREVGDKLEIYYFHPEDSTKPQLISIMQSSAYMTVEGLVIIGNNLLSPSRRESVNLPPLPRSNFRGKLTRSTYNFLGFDGLTNQYKVISISKLIKSLNPLNIETTYVSKILTLGINLWENIDLGSNELFLHLGHITSGCVNGVLYMYPYYTDMITAFEVRTHNSRLIPFPHKDVFPFSWELHDVGGNLVLFNRTSKVIWMLDDEKVGIWKQIVVNLAKYSSPYCLTLSWEVLENGKWKEIDSDPPAIEKLSSPLNPYFFSSELESAPELFELLNGYKYSSFKLVETLFPLKISIERLMDTKLVQAPILQIDLGNLSSEEEYYRDEELCAAARVSMSDSDNGED